MGTLSGPHGRRPAEDATVIRSGRLLLAANAVAWWIVVVLFVGAAVLSGLLAHGIGRDVLVGVFCFLSFLTLFMQFGAWVGRHERFVLDAEGWWWFQEMAEDVVFLPWDSLAAVAIYSTGDAAAHPTATLELFPRGAIDRDDRLLWKRVRDADPPAPGLPRLRYRIPLTYAIDQAGPMEEACRERVPAGLWLGRIWQPDDYVGAPDRAGYRRRKRKRKRVPLFVAPASAIAAPEAAAGSAAQDAAGAAAQHAAGSAAQDTAPAPAPEPSDTVAPHSD